MKKSRSKKVSKSRSTGRKLGRHCPTGEILRSGYTRKAYSRISKSGSRSRVERSKVSPTCILDRGKPGKGPKLFKVTKPGLLRDEGYSLKRSTMSRRHAIDQAIKKSPLGEDNGRREVLRHLNAIRNYRSYNKKSADYKEMSDDVNYIKNKYFPERRAIERSRSLRKSRKSRKSKK